jgi:hypothetical protein
VNVDPDVALVDGYAVALLAIATGLDSLAQHVQRRSERFRTAGFRYHPHHDAWICPQDQMLWPVHYDAEQHLVRYRARPSVCNACPIKSGCTSSAHGREITRATTPWPDSEAGRFHRGLALALVVLAGIFAVTTAFAARTVADLALLLGVLGLVSFVGWRLTDHLRGTPANFPEPTAATGLRVTRGSRTRWGSDAWEDQSWKHQ